MHVPVYMCDCVCECVCGDQVILFVDRQLETVYPQYPSEKEFLNHIQGLGLKDGEQRILSRFVIENKDL